MRVAEIVKRIFDSTAADLIDTTLCISIMTDLQSLLSENRHFAVADPRVEELITEIIFCFSPCARLSEFLVRSSCKTTNFIVRSILKKKWMNINI
jgi:hypothetical protein